MVTRTEKRKGEWYECIAAMVPGPEDLPDVPGGRGAPVWVVAEMVAVAAARRLGISEIATVGHNFDTLHGLLVYEPDDVSAR